MRASTFFALALTSLIAVKAALAFRAFQNLVDGRRSRHHLYYGKTTAVAPPTALPMVKSSVTADAPPLRRNPSRKICLMVEPTPFTQ